MLKIRLLTISLYRSVDIIINFYFLVLVVMNLNVGAGYQASFDAWGAEEMKKAEEYALALRERFAGEENPDYDPSWFLLINPVASRQSRSTKNKLAFKEMMLVRHGFVVARNA